MYLIPFWKKIISWFYPFNIETFQTDKNKCLEVNLQYGQLVVDTKNANYSFGNLHLVFQQVIDSLNLSLQKNYKILILGFGAGSISEILYSKDLNYKITGIEYDSTIIEIANKYFSNTLKNVEINIIDAELFVENDNNSYDLIFVDLFSDTNIPNKFMTNVFLNNVNELLNNNGSVFMNTMNKPEELFKNWKFVFKDFNFLDIQENRVLIFNK